MNTAKNNYSLSGLQTYTSGIEMPQDFTSCRAWVKAYLENLELVQKINTLGQINDLLQRADAYKKIFGNCCETPQTQIIS